MPRGTTSALGLLLRTGYSPLMCSVAQSCLTLQPGSSVHEISQVRMLEWVAIFYSREYS